MSGISIPLTLDDGNSGAKTIEGYAKALTKVANRFDRVTASANAMKQALSSLPSGSGPAPASGGSGPGGSGGSGGSSGGSSPRAPLPFSRRLLNAVYSTRINMGMASPLLGRMMALTGVGASSPWALPVAGAVAALGAFTSATMATAERLSSLADSAGYAGTNMRGARRLEMMGKTGQDAAAFQGRIESGYGAAAAMSAGINPIGGPFGDINYEAKYRKAFNALMTMPEDQAKRTAMAWGMEDALKYRNADPRLRGAMMAEPGATPNDDRNAGNVSVMKNLINQRIKKIGEDITTPFIYGLGTFLGITSDAMKGKETKENTKAIKELNQTVNKSIRAMGSDRQSFGSGTRNGGYLPFGLKYGEAMEAIRQNKIRFGDI